MPVVLAAGSSRGWFEGRTLVAWSPCRIAQGVTVREAAETLEDAFDATRQCMAVALLPYDGTATVAHYGGGLVLTDRGWRVWGDLNAEDVPSLGEWCCTDPAS